MISTHDVIFQKNAKCKICGTHSNLYGVADFSKSCEEAKKKYLPLLGVPIYYHKCGNCGLIFTVSFDEWSVKDFSKFIYNDDYIEVDPDYIEARPTGNAKMVYDFIKANTSIRLLDYGGGNALQARLLRDKQINCDSWDPLVPSEFFPQSSYYDLITAFEVLEHTPTPVETTKQILQFLKENGAFLFSTLTIDGLPDGGIGFWYISPRNGHVTIYTQKSLDVLFLKFGYSLHHFNNLMHLAYRKIPPWLSYLF